MRYIIDSDAWLEYFMGSEAGKKVKEIIDTETDEKLAPSLLWTKIDLGKRQPAAALQTK